MPGAALYSYYTTGELKSEGSSITEGIGQGRITNNIEGAVVDRAYLIPDAESVADRASICCEDEGLCLGGSTGINVAGAIRLAKELGPGHTIVTLLCDYGTRYQSKLFNPAFLRSKNLPVPEWLVAERPPLPKMFVDREEAELMADRPCASVMPALVAGIQCNSPAPKMAARMDGRDKHGHDVLCSRVFLRQAGI